MNLQGKRILVTGGTGSLGKTVVRRLLSAEERPARITVFSRDEAKQHQLRLSIAHLKSPTDEVIFKNSRDVLRFAIGDVRDFPSLARAARDVDVVFNAAALKQVPTCEYFPWEAVKTNVMGAVNIVRAIREHRLPVELVVGISTDKACKPINVMGMTKALQERVFVEANLGAEGTRFVCVRYGNVIASRGSVVPLFQDQIARGGPVTVTLKEMTRFLLTLDRAADTVFAATARAKPGETWVPKVPSALVVDIARSLIGGRDIPITFTGIRPGEKIHEIMVSEEEAYRTVDRGDYFAIRPMLPELAGSEEAPQALTGEYSSSHVTLDQEGIRGLIESHGLIDSEKIE